MSQTWQTVLLSLATSLMVSLITFKIYPDGITVSASEYAEWLFLALGKNVEGYTELCNRKESLILRIDKLNKKLERKAKEPVGFWETMFGAFADMFR